LEGKVKKYKCKCCGKICDTKPEENCIVTCDMSGCELRIIAELAHAQTWITAFAKGWDVHSVSTEILYPEKWPTLALPDCAYYAKDANGEPKRQKCKCPGHKELRDKTKATNFLLCYGGGPTALADELGITTDEAKELMKNHEARFPDIWEYLRRSGILAKQDMQARDMFGRRRLFLPPTREAAIAWFKEEKADKLLLNDDEIAAAIDFFKRKELREPKHDEMDILTHREPTEKEIQQAWRALEGSIERRGKNHCIQATNASIIKRSMGCGFDKNGTPYLWHTLPQYKARIQSMVHDELIVHCPKRFGKKVAELIADAFARAAAEVMHTVKMESEFHIAERWMK
jgi:DNA polymerase I-like protein with 3'-5' exonuclease and polymerase domains